MCSRVDFEEVGVDNLDFGSVFLDRLDKGFAPLTITLNGQNRGLSDNGFGHSQSFRMQI